MYTDLLTKIRNAQKARKERLKIPYSKMDMSVAEILAEHKYIAGVEKRGRMPRRTIEVRLQYDSETERGAIHGVKFISLPSRRIYTGYRNFQSVKQGYGLAIVSTPKGLMTQKKAREAKLGGEILFEIW